MPRRSTVKPARLLRPASALPQKTFVGGVSDADIALHHDMRAIMQRDQRLETADNGSDGSLQEVAATEIRHGTIEPLR